MDTYIKNGRIKKGCISQKITVTANASVRQINDKDTENEVLYIDTELGLSEKQMSKSLKAFGKNQITRSKKLSFTGQFIKNLGDPIIRILIGAMLINILFMFRSINWPETVGIAAAVFIATLVSTISEYGSEKAFEKLNAEADKTVYTVIRHGRKELLHETELLCGDVILIGAGEIIPADCIVTEGIITVSQAPLTGESKEIKKEPQAPHAGKVSIGRSTPFNVNDKTRIFKGCLCLNGECRAVVGKVGDSTFMGSVANDLQKSPRPSPLKERLSALAKTVSILGYIAAALIMIAYLTNVIVIDSSFNITEILLKLRNVKFMASSLLNAVTLGVSVIVVAVPEGLPMMITVVLSSNMKRMLKGGVLVRKPVGIETAGSMNILFTDKTGTLTTGNMKITEAITRDAAFENAKDLSKNKNFKKYLIPLSEGLIASGKRTSTEKAVHNFSKDVSKDIKKDVLLKKLSFNSKNKYSACLYSHANTEYVYILGAAEKLLEKCSFFVSSDGGTPIMTGADKNYFYSAVSRKTGDSARVLALVKTGSEDWENICRGELRDNLCAVMLLSIKDDLRPDIKRSVNTAKSAGVQVVMITGDNKETALSIAKEAGIIDSMHDKVLTGEELTRLSDEELSEILPRLAVVSRALPSDKLRLVELSGKMGLVSGMTGDGINDAPSLKGADVGFAMGSGSDVAKEASDIILTNNSFHSITKAILYGRTVFESIRKFITFQLTMNLCAMGVSLICPFIGIESPITVIQMLWVNIIMDTLGGLAFAGEIPLAKYMKRPPINKKEKILTGRMICQILYLGGYTLVLSIAFLKIPFFKTLIEGSKDVYFLTCFFALFIFCGISNSFNARSPTGNLLSNLAGNKAFISIILFVCIGQIGIIYFGGETFRTVPLSLHDLAVCAVLSLSVIPADMIRKLFMSKEK